MNDSPNQQVWYMQLYNLQQNAPKPFAVLTNSTKYSHLFIRNVDLIDRYGEVYHGNIQRLDGANLLSTCVSGSYLIRDSSTGDFNVTLVIKFDDEVKNYRLFYDQSKGEHYVGEKRFSKMEELVADGLIHFYIESRGRDLLHRIDSFTQYDKSPYMLERERYYTLQMRQQQQQQQQCKDHQSQDSDLGVLQEIVEGSNKLHLPSAPPEEDDGEDEEEEMLDDELLDGLETCSSSSDSGVNSSNSCTSSQILATIREKSVDKRGSPCHTSTGGRLADRLSQASSCRTLPAGMACSSQRDSVCSSHTLQAAVLPPSPPCSSSTSTSTSSSSRDAAPMMSTATVVVVAAGSADTGLAGKRRSSGRSLPAPMSMAGSSSSSHSTSPMCSPMQTPTGLGGRRATMGRQGSTAGFARLVGGGGGAGAPPRSHNTKQTTFVGPHWCDVCSHFMWGLVQQGMVCMDCGMRAHKKCCERAPNDCVPDMKLMKRVFGVELTSLVVAENCEVPLVLQRLIHELERRNGHLTEGIYRECGMYDEIEELKMALNKDVLGTDLSRYRDINVFSSLTKRFFQLLPIPLMCFSLYQDMVTAAEAVDPSEKVRLVQAILLRLPPAHFTTLRFLMCHIKRISDNCMFNQMDSSNLGRIFSPTLIRSPMLPGFTSTSSSTSTSNSMMSRDVAGVMSAPPASQPAQPFTLNSQSMQTLMFSVNRENAFVKFLIDSFPQLYDLPYSLSTESLYPDLT